MVLSVEPLSKQIEVTLKIVGSRAQKSKVYNLSSLHFGAIISGRIKRVESFGLFIAIDNTNSAVPVLWLFPDMCVSVAQNKLFTRPFLFYAIAQVVDGNFLVHVRMLSENLLVLSS